MIKQSKEVFMHHEKKVYEYSMKNDYIEVCFINIGGSLTKVAIKEDNFNENLILRWNDYRDYIVNDGFQGALVGRTAGRIKNAKFTINDVEYQLDQNDGNNNLHGGLNCLTYQYFNVTEIENGYELSYFSPHLESHFPGDLEIKVLYTLHKDEFKITYMCKSEQDTYVNMTNHMFINLNGNSRRDIKNHLLTINSDQFLEIDQEMLATGKLLSVKSTPFDFTTPKLVGQELNSEHQQIKFGNGYDITLQLNGGDNCIKVFESESKRKLTISTNYQAVQLYSGNFITQKMVFENNHIGEKNLGLCLETELVPFLDNILLRKGELYNYYTALRFTKETL
ncbi:MAG: galactose mutarotase [Haloplasmataceae bacterium]|nr:galactose mutarotase [Haloplasmataceae bacterium]